MNARIVTCLGLSSVFCLALSLAPGQEKTAKKYAVLVGVKKYKHEKLPVLKYTENDVVELDKMLRQAGYTVTLLCDSTGKQDPKLVPDKANIERVITAVLKQC